MLEDGKLLIAKGDDKVYLLPSMSNRHGIIAGATGTGKTVTVKTIAESFSQAGVPCFLADVKGDVSGLAVPGEASDKLLAHLGQLGITQYTPLASPVRFWDVYGQNGIPVRTTITEMGPVLISRLLGLTEVQEGVMNIVFHVADDQKMLLLDLKDLRAVVGYVGEHADEYTTTYGNVAPASIGAIQRALLALDDAGGGVFFGEPALDIADWFKVADDGRGYLNILNCVRLVQSPLLYSTFLLWMLSELYERLPEMGDLDKPKMVFFFDEAHLLFDDAPKGLIDKIQQVVKLIRSKGVGIFFITQNPADIDDEVLAQLGNRVEHALRAYTPGEQKGIKAAADAFRANPKLDTQEAITQLGTGEALISFLDEKGVPTVVQKAGVIAPQCSMSAAPDQTIHSIVSSDPLLAKYATSVDRESAYEKLAAKIPDATAAPATVVPAAATGAAQTAQTAQSGAAQQPVIASEQTSATDPVAAAKANSSAQRQVELANKEAAKAEAAAQKAEAKLEAQKEKDRASLEKKAINVVVGGTASGVRQLITKEVSRGLTGVLKKFF